MTPLRVTARLAGEIALPDGYLHLDGLLAFAVALRDGIPPALTPEEMTPIEVPIEREPGGRFHLASASVGRFERRETKHLHRRFPIAEAQRLSDLNRVNLAAGPQKNFRIPYEVGHLYEDRLDWYAVGDLEEVRSLVGLHTHIGKKRSAGRGRVVAWAVEPCEPWPGFPVLDREGRALRNLPLDWPGLRVERTRIGRLTFPYWSPLDETEAAIPEGA